MMFRKRTPANPVTPELVATALVEVRAEIVNVLVLHADALRAIDERLKGVEAATKVLLAERVE